MRTLTIIGAAAIMLAAVAWAQVPIPQAYTFSPVSLQPAEIDTIGCDFTSWAISGNGTATVRLIGKAAQADASPSSIIVAGPTASGNIVSVRIKPDQGCGATGCRNGNSYQITLQPASGSDAPICDFRVDVRKVVFQ